MHSIAELGRRAKAKHPGKYDKIADQELGLRLRAKYPAYAKSFSDSTTATPQSSKGPLGGHSAEIQKAPTLGQKIIRGKTLPIGGGIAGGLAGATFSGPAAAAGAAVGALGGPLAPATVPLGAFIGGSIPPMIGAAAGGAGLEGVRQNIARLMGEKAPEDAVEALKQIGGAAGEQAINEVGGRVLLSSVRQVARPIMQAALRANPELGDLALRYGTGATKAGLAKVNALWDKVVKAEQHLAIEAGRAGVRIPAYTLADAAYKAVADKLKGAPRGEFVKLAIRYNRFVRQHPSSIKPLNALELRKYNDRMSTGLRSAREASVNRGKPPPPAGVKEMWQKELGDQTRQFLQSRVPELGVDLKHSTPQRIASTRAHYRALTGSSILPSEAVKLKAVIEGVVTRTPSILRMGLERGGPAAVGASVGAFTSSDHVGGAMRGTAVGAAAGVAMSPAMLSRVALAPENPLMAQFLLNLPRLISTAKVDTTTRR